MKSREFKKLYLCLDKQTLDIKDQLKKKIKRKKAACRVVESRDYMTFGANHHGG